VDADSSTIGILMFWLQSLLRKKGIPMLSRNFTLDNGEISVDCSTNFMVQAISIDNTSSSYLEVVSGTNYFIPPYTLNWQMDLLGAAYPTVKFVTDPLTPARPATVVGGPVNITVYAEKIGLSLGFAFPNSGSVPTRSLIQAVSSVSGANGSVGPFGAVPGKTIRLFGIILQSANVPAATIWANKITVDSYCNAVPFMYLPYLAVKGDQSPCCVCMFGLGIDLVPSAGITFDWVNAGTDAGVTGFNVVYIVQYI
jgi:hypothetical protein